MAAARIQPTIDEVLVAVRTLYADEIRPLGRILLRRLREHAAESAAKAAGLDPAIADPEAMGLIEPKFLRELCEGCSTLTVAPMCGKEYSVELAGQEGPFVDPCCLEDPYPGQLWRELGAYIASLGEAAGVLPSGRYACAQALAARQLAFFQGCSLGKLCHIVQLAIAQKQMLGHANGKVVPYSRSDACLKLRCAVRQQPVSHAAEREVPFVTWADLGAGLHAVLASSSATGPGTATVSNIKGLFRSQLGKELSETVLGYARIGDLLQDARLRHICSVHASSQGQSLVCLRGAVPAPPSQVAYAPLSVAAAWGTHGSSTCASQRVPLPPPSPAPALCLSASPVTSALRRSAEEFVPPWAQSGGDDASGAAAVRSISATSTSLDAAQGKEGEAVRTISATSTTLDAAQGREDQSSTCASTFGAPDSESECGEEPLATACVKLEDYGLVVKNGFLDEAPRQRRRRSRSV